jgi:hypothetical protein
MDAKITFDKKLNEEELTKYLRNITFRGLYDENGEPLKPYAKAKFSLVKVHPPERPTSFPQVMHEFRPQPLFTAQPTIYKSSIDLLSQVDKFLLTIGKRIHTLSFEAVHYNWEGRGYFHVLPPIIEKHSYPLVQGSFNLKKLAERFKGAYVKDARNQLHELGKGVIKGYYVDKESKVNYMDIFNSNAELINYGLRFNGPHEFYIICDGSHRMDYALEHLNEPVNALLVESDEDLFPYYALPMPFRPATRLSSKAAEVMYPKLERDKVHLLSDFIKKILHYDWEAGGLRVGSLRSKPKIF